MSWTDDYIKERDEKSPGFAKLVAEEGKKLDIAVELHQLRESLGMSQRELAELVGKPQSTIARIETGAMFPSFKLINEIALATGKEVSLKFL